MHGVCKASKEVLKDRSSKGGEQEEYEQVAGSVAQRRVARSKGYALSDWYRDHAIAHIDLEFVLLLMTHLSRVVGVDNRWWQCDSLNVCRRTWLGKDFDLGADIWRRQCGCGCD
jgi:hypothetical protein